MRDERAEQKRDESRAEERREQSRDETRTEQRRDESSAEARPQLRQSQKQRQKRDADAEAKGTAQRRKPAEFRAMNLKETRAGTAGNARSFIGTCTTRAAVAIFALRETPI